MDDDNNFASDRQNQGESAVMREYEIRVLSGGRPTLIIEEIHLSDHSAVRSARKFAGERPFEVWRGIDCIYAAVEAPRVAAKIHQGGHPS